MKNFLKTLFGIFIIPVVILSQVQFQFGECIRYDNSPIQISFGSNESRHINYPGFGYRDEWDSDNTTDATLELFIKYGKCNNTLTKPFDFESGQQYMENNGYALSKALKLIKDSLDNNGSTEKLVVCGASMGGHVSRFAIRDPELHAANTYKNCAGKFISFDRSQMKKQISNT